MRKAHWNTTGHTTLRQSCPTLSRVICPNAMPTMATCRNILTSWYLRALATLCRITSGVLSPLPVAASCMASTRNCQGKQGFVKSETLPPFLHNYCAGIKKGNIPPHPPKIRYSRIMIRLNVINNFVFGFLFLIHRVKDGYLAAIFKY